MALDSKVNYITHSRVTGNSAGERNIQMHVRLDRAWRSKANLFSFQTDCKAWRRLLMETIIKAVYIGIIDIVYIGTGRGNIKGYLFCTLTT